MRKILLVLLSLFLVTGCAELEEVNETVTEAITDANEIISAINEGNEEEVVERDPIETTPIEDILIQGLKDRSSEIDISAFKLNDEQVKDIYYKVVNDNPQYFWVQTTFEYTYYADGIVIAVKPKYQDLGDIETYENAISEALKVVDEDMYDAEIALVLHDYLALNTKYDEAYLSGAEVSPVSYSSYGALVNQVAVCQGYSLAYIDLLKRCNIEAHYVSSEAMNHGWVQVKIEDEWYHVDVTWDDPYPDTPGNVNHQYFLKSDSSMGLGDQPHHNWTSEYTCSKDYAGVWDIAKSAVYVERHQMIYVDGEPGSIRLMYKNLNTGEDKTLVTMNEKATWHIKGELLGGYWEDIFTKLIYYNGKLYFNTAEDIYSLNLANSEVVKLTFIEPMNGYINGFDFKNSQIRIYLTFDPNEQERNLYTINLY